jgi:hypothetical protein
MTVALTSTPALGTLSAPLQWLADRPACLLAALLALNAVARPYAGFYHDARLYSAQVLNQADPGCYADDLFFRYGSQDQLSVFSRLVAPLASSLGIEVTFFALFLVLNALFFFALQRFVLALVDDAAIGVLALVFMAVTPLAFSGLSILQVQEPFLTPRPLANALVLFGLERLLRHQYVTAVGLVILALPVHPIMALGGLLVWLAFLAFTLLRPFVAIGLVAATSLAGLGVILYEPLGVRLFGTMDSDWREMVRAATIFNFPLEWYGSDWLNQAVSFAVLLGAAFGLPGLDGKRRRFALALALVGVAGLTGTFVGSLGPYALLFQGQPSRVLWILKVTQVALGFVLIAEWSRSSHRLARVAAVGLAVFFSVTSYLGVELFVLALALPFCCIAYRGLDATPQRADWAWRAAFMSLAIGAVLWAAYKCGLLVSFRERVLAQAEPDELVMKVALNVGPVVFLMVFAFTMRLLHNHGWLAGRWLVGVCITLTLLWHTAFFATATEPTLRAHATHYGADLAMVRDYLGKHANSDGTRPTVYCPLGHVNYLWVDLRAKSYFDWAQVVGVMFNRETAVEARRRAVLVRAFELARMRDEFELTPDPVRRSIRLLFQADVDYPDPSVDDLRRLCQEPGLDFLLLQHEFPGVSAASCGKLFVYDCRQVRAALGLPEPDSAATAVARVDAPREDASATGHSPERV